MAERICVTEGRSGAVEISLLFCDDHRIRDLNREFRKIDRATDVLSFVQDETRGKTGADLGPAVLGDIVISLETVAERCDNATEAMRREVRLLFCHGLLHLLGYDHGTESERRIMAAKQAEYLKLSPAEAWPAQPRRQRAES
jgi:probable rRNA maturation factor